MHNTFIMEPMLPEEGRLDLEDKATELISRSSALAGRLHPLVRQSIGDLIRSMNCYYSNLIEGHDTHPRDIDRALAENFSNDAKKRELQLEAKAHIEVQRLIDTDTYTVSMPMVSKNFITWIHREFCSRLPDELLWVKNPDSGAKINVIPGLFRTGDVQVGHHIPPPAEDIELFMARFEQVYRPERLSRLRCVMAVAASHHRLLWIHPFYDGNGRVARLFSHAFFKEIGIGTSLWSVSRGLARNVENYKKHLISADAKRQGDLDGRGALSLKGLNRFSLFFLETCIDQVTFMEGLLEPEALMRRMEFYCEDEARAGRLLRGSWPLLREALYVGEFERGRAATITGYKERQARTVLNDLIAKKLLASDTPKGRVHLGFPIDVVERWFPKLYPVAMH